MSKNTIHNSDTDRALLARLRRLQNDNYFGEVQLIFHHGRITLIREIRTIKPSELNVDE